MERQEFAFAPISFDALQRQEFAFGGGRLGQRHDLVQDLIELGNSSHSICGPQGACCCATETSSQTAITGISSTAAAIDGQPSTLRAFDRIYEAGNIQEVVCWARVRGKFYDIQVAQVGSSKGSAGTDRSAIRNGNRGPRTFARRTARKSEMSAADHCWNR